MVAADVSTSGQVPVHPRNTHRTIIEPTRRWQGFGFAELWRYRELLTALVVRDIRLRYKQTVLGFLWAAIQPFLYMVVFTILLHNVGGVEGDPGVPYPVFTYGGLLVWNYFADSLNRSASSLVSNKVLVSKVYFPRLTAPLSGVVSPLLDFVVGFIVLLGIMWHYNYGIGVHALLLPLCLVLAILAATAFGVWFAAINVKYRDVAYAMSFIVQIWMFVSPVVYSAQSLTGTRKFLYALNPMGGVVLGFRRGVVGHGPFGWDVLGIGTAVSVVVFFTGLLYFRRVERTFADAI